MKIVFRLMILTLTLAAASYAQSSSYSGPGTPPASGPPVAIA